MIKYIDVNCPISRGKPMPKFNPKMVNEDRFEDELRPKDFYICLDTDHNVCNVEWLSQEADYFSDDLSAELIRALKANGARPGTEVYVKYGIRGQVSRRLKREHQELPGIIVRKTKGND